jgi:hypothetical protein
MGSSQFTAPVTGYYAFFGNVRYDAANGAYYRLMIVKNGDNEVNSGGMHINGVPPTNCKSVALSMGGVLYVSLVIAEHVDLEEISHTNNLVFLTDVIIFFLYFYYYYYVRFRGIVSISCLLDALRSIYVSIYL